MEEIFVSERVNGVRKALNTLHRGLLFVQQPAFHPLPVSSDTEKWRQPSQTAKIRKNVDTLFPEPPFRDTIPMGVRFLCEEAAGPEVEFMRE